MEGALYVEESDKRSPPLSSCEDNEKNGIAVMKYIWQDKNCSIDGEIAYVPQELRFSYLKIHKDSVRKQLRQVSLLT